MAVSAEAIPQPASGPIQGDVALAPGVAIAPGVCLGAAPGCRLVIATGVCLGADVVVQAQGGDLLLEPGVSLGSGVLVVGWGAIAQHTCIGANSTVINPDLGPSQVVAPNSLVGDPSQAAAADIVGELLAEPVTDPWAEAPGSQAETGTGQALSSGAQNGHGQDGSVHRGPSQNGITQSDITQNGSASSQVYGRTQVNRMLSTLFPHRQALADSSNDAAPEYKP